MCNKKLCFLWSDELYKTNKKIIPVCDVLSVAEDPGQYNISQSFISQWIWKLQDEYNLWWCLTVQCDTSWWLLQHVSETSMFSSAKQWLIMVLYKTHVYCMSKYPTPETVSPVSHEHWAWPWYETTHQDITWILQLMGKGKGEVWSN